MRLSLGSDSGSGSGEVSMMHRCTFNGTATKCRIAWWTSWGSVLYVTIEPTTSYPVSGNEIKFRALANERRRGVYRPAQLSVQEPCRACGKALGAFSSVGAAAGEDHSGRFRQDIDVQQQVLVAHVVGIEHH